MNTHQPLDALIVGGGLAGLAAAGYVARAGRSVLVLERSEQLGGRARTQEEGGFRFNIGPHALYNDAPGMAVLRDLGVPFTGKPPRVDGALAVVEDRLEMLPGGPASLLRTRLLGLRDKVEVARILGGLPKLDLAPLRGVPLAAWLASEVRGEPVRALLRALVRLSTYANDPDRMSAGAALENFRLALAKNVLYLDGGWRTLVDGLRKVAEDAGAKVVAGARVTRVAAGDGLALGGAAWRVTTADGAEHTARAAILAVAPGAAAEITGGDGASALKAWSEECLPVQAACLDLALTGLPEPKRLFALGIDAPTYFSVHSVHGKLAPEGGAVVHVAKYLAPGEPVDARATERELEALADRVQPGWRARVAHRRYLPAMTVTGALVTARMGGLAGRPGPRVPGAKGLFVAGDWVGPEGMLADAALASARRAAGMILEEPRS